MPTESVTESMLAGDLQEATRRARRGNEVQDLMGLSVLRHDAEGTAVTMELTERVRGAAEGTVHGGLLATLADVTSAFSLAGIFDPTTEVPVTTDMHIRYYRQPRSGPILAVARVVHKGRRLLSVECSVADAEQRILARATATYMLVPWGG
jgi:uncharacterized protein (TIGR00369 family)